MAVVGLSEQAREVRATRIGASEVAAVLGISPWSGPFDVWARLKYGIEKAEAPEMAAGRYLERAVLDWFEDQGHPLARNVAAAVHPVHDWLSCTPDAETPYAIVMAPPEGVEAKTCRDRSAYGEPGTDQVPAYYAAQAQAQCAVRGYARVHQPVLFTQSSEFAHFVIPRDEPVIAAITAQLAAWHDKHIVHGIMPDLDGGSAAAAYLKQRYPGGSGVMPEATTAQAALVREYVQGKGEEKALEDRVSVIRQRLILEIGNNDGLVLADGGRCSYRADKAGKRSLRLSGFKGA